MAVIDTSSNEISSWIDLPAVGYGTASTLDGKWLLVTMQTANQVAVVDLSQMKVVRTVPVGADPVQILARPIGRTFPAAETERSQCSTWKTGR